MDNVIMNVVYESFNIYPYMITFECNFYCYEYFLNHLKSFSSNTTNIGVIICFPYIIKYLSHVLQFYQSSNMYYLLQNASCLVIYKDNYLVAVIINQENKVNNFSYYISAKVIGLQNIVF